VHSKAIQSNSNLSLLLLILPIYPSVFFPYVSLTYFFIDSIQDDLRGLHTAVVVVAVVVDLVAEEIAAVAADLAMVDLADAAVDLVWEETAVAVADWVYERISGPVLRPLPASVRIDISP
jgi:hypothetical protein